MNWEKLCSNLSFTVENKMGNLHKAGHISNLKKDPANALTPLSLNVNNANMDSKR